jgi:type II secretory pathway pseudopilin PulG
MAGYSLVELLVASTILVVAIISIVTVVRKGSDLEVSDKHLRQARTIMNSVFESPVYRSGNYANLANDTRTVVIDPRGSGTTDDLSGTLAIAVTSATASGSNMTTINYKKVQLTLSWNEPEGAQALTLARMVTP